MSYTVLARKYRSRTLDEIVGQEPIVTTLKNAITSGRVHHGFLFCGTRGVGKTSTARVLAKSLNCLSVDAPTVTPCCNCDSCTAIAEGGDIDVIEIDGASHTGVDDIRELRSNASYRPTRARYKIYIIDEVHMLSKGAFNALLKTLEEPPEHVKFIFATTELQKVPATIQSRVQRFEFQNIAVKLIVKQICGILESEGIESDEAVVRRVARYANGSMRDALSLLDQLLSFGGGRIDAHVIDEILPTQHSEHLTALVDHLSGGDAAAALVATEQYLAAGQTQEQFCHSLIEHLRMLMLICVCGPDNDLVDVPATVRDRAIVQSGAFDDQTYVYMITVLEALRRQVRSSGAGRALVDAAIVRLAGAKNFSSVTDLLTQLDRAESPESKKKVDNMSGTRLSSAGSPRPADRRIGAADMRRSGTHGGPQVTEVADGRRANQVGRPDHGRVSSKEMAAARGDPLVRAALETFDGSLIGVRKVAVSHADLAGDESPEATEGE